MPNLDFYKDAKFVPDSPAAVDEFSTGGHARVAGTLVHIVTSNSGGRAIGLEGTWGSGKSTVVDIALTALRAGRTEHRFATFIFDAWAHQGDPLRRVFLEELIGHLSKEGVVDSTYWSSELEKLRARRKKTVEEKAERLSLTARVAIVAIPFYPLAYALILQFFSKHAGNSWLLAVGLLIASAPLLVGLLTWLSWRQWGFRQDWYKPKKGKEGKSVITAFARQTDHVVTEQFIREDEATTIEFNLKFDELLMDAKAHDTILVIVLDNLDRLANEQIRDIWGTMRNFFAASPGSGRRDALSNAWLVVPFDRRHIESVFADDRGGGDKTRGFVEKTFEVVLRVPPPLLSNWQMFLEGRLKLAFGEKVSIGDLYKIYRFFELYLLANPSPVTPRSIKAYVNKIVSQAKLSGDSIPIAYQALYVLYSTKIDEDISALQESSLLDESVRVGVDDDDWAKYLAAAHYNTPSTDDALELLLGGEIENSLIGKNVERLLAVQRTKGFNLLLHRIVGRQARVWAAEQPDAFLSVVAAIDQLPLDTDPAQLQLWRDLGYATVAIVKPVSIDTAHVATIAALVARSDVDRKVPVARELWRAIAGHTENAGDDLALGRTWFSMAEAIVRTLSEDPTTRDAVPSLAALPLPQATNFAFGVGQAANESSWLTIDKFTFPVDAAPIQAALEGAINDAAPPDWLDGVVAAFSRAKSALNWKGSIAAIQARLQQNTPSSSGGVALRFLSILNELATTQGRANTALGTMANDGTLHGWLQIGLREKNDDLVPGITFD